MKIKQLFLICVWASGALWSLPSLAADLKGSADHPLVARYEGSRIINFKLSEFDEYTGALGPANNSRKIEDEIELEGKVTKILYRAPKGRSSLEVFKNYEQHFSSAGFEVLFSCKKSKCGPGFYVVAQRIWGGDIFITDLDSPRYMAAKLARDEGDVWAFLFVGEHTLMNSLSGAYASLVVVDMVPMQKKMVTLKADELDKSLRDEGHVAVPGIFFDTDKDTLKASSKAAIDEVGKLLTTNNELKVHIVGHSDDVGEFAYNLDLSKRRAAAVANALIKDYGISSGRLTVNGVGPLAPVSSNKSDKGRAKNRRVELVEQ